MSYTRTITSNGNSISQEGGQSFNQQLDDLQEQIEEGGGGSITDLGTSSGTANALAGASLVDTATTFTAGRLYRIRTNAANSGAATCSINGGTGVAMKKSPSSAALASGDIADATELLLYYDGTNLQVLSGLTVSATDSTKLPTDGSGSMTGPMIHSANGTATSSNYEIVRITNKYVRNVPSGKAISDRVNGVEMLGLDGNGDTFSIGRVDDGYSYVVGNYGNNYYNCPYGGTHLFRVNGAVIGHFPLTPSDMPSQVAKYSRTTSNQGSLSGSYVANTVGLNSVDSNIGTNWSFSGGVATCLNAGVYDLVAQLGYSSQEGGFVINHNGNAIGVYYYYSASSLLFGSINIPEVSVGAGDTIKLEFFSSAATGVIYYTYTGFPTTVPDKHATWLRMTRRQ